LQRLYHYLTNNRPFFLLPRKKYSAAQKFYSRRKKFRDFDKPAMALNMRWMVGEQSEVEWINQANEMMPGSKNSRINQNL
jgi:hypothetical protein